MLNSPIMHTTPTENIPEAPELGTPRYKGQNFGSQWCPLLRGSTINIVPFPKWSSTSQKGKCHSIWGMKLICWIIPLATHCHTHYHLHLFYFVLFKLIAKQHPTETLHLSRFMVFDIGCHCMHTNGPHFL